MKKYRIKDQEIEMDINDAAILRDELGLSLEEVKPEVKKLYAYRSMTGIVYFSNNETIENADRAPHFDLTFDVKDSPKLIDIMKKAIIKIDEWQGKQSCYGSVYTIDDDTFGELQSIVHEALEEFRRNNG